MQNRLVLYTDGAGSVTGPTQLCMDDYNGQGRPAETQSGL
jgi:hypothetical protein